MGAWCPAKVRLLQGQNMHPPQCYSSCCQHAHQSPTCCIPLGAAQCLPSLPPHPKGTLLFPQPCATLLPWTKHLLFTVQEMLSSQPVQAGEATSSLAAGFANSAQKELSQSAQPHIPCPAAESNRLCPTWLCHASPGTCCSLQLE